MAISESKRALLDSGDKKLFDVPTKAPGPEGSLPLTPEMLINLPSGDLFGWTQNAGMGWDPKLLGGAEVLLLSTHGGIRAEDGSAVALGYHTGHWEVNLLVEAAARELKRAGAVPFAGYVTDPCDGRSQGTPGMYDSLPYRNDASQVFRRLIRSLPNRKGVVGVATCDKGLPAMMMALAATRDLPTVLVPGGVTLAPEDGEDAGKVQTIGARYAHGTITLEHAAEMGCRACASPGGGCQFLGTAATSQVVGEALGLTLPHSALAPSGAPVWRDMAVRSAKAMLAMIAAGTKTRDILTAKALENAMTVYAAFGGSTNVLMHLAAVAYHAGLPQPSVEDWRRVHLKIPRLVDALPNGPRNHPTAQVFLAGAVPEVMLHLRNAGLLHLDALTVSGCTVGENLEWWEASERRTALRNLLAGRDQVDPDDVILSPEEAKRRGITATISFLTGNLAPGGAVIKSTSIDPSVVDADNVYRKRGKAKVFQTEAAAIKAIKQHEIEAGDILVLHCRGPMGSGMEETYQLTSALKHLEFGKHVAVITDARFSGVSTGACIGHVSPEALAGGPIGKVRTGDEIEIVVDRTNLTGHVELVGEDPGARPVPEHLAEDAQLPDDTRLWAALQEVSGGTWAGAVYDVEKILAVIAAGRAALKS
jgi:putative YjhG/YagF family dehydratase